MTIKMDDNKIYHYQILSLSIPNNDKPVDPFNLDNNPTALL